MSTEMKPVRSDRPIYLALAAAAAMFLAGAPAVSMAVPGATLPQSLRLAGVGAMLIVALALLLAGVLAEARGAAARAAAAMPEPMGQEPVLPMARAA